MFEEDLEKYLKEDSNISLLCNGRVFPVTLPQNTRFPAIVYQIISGERVNSHGGQSGLVETRTQITCFHSNYYLLKEFVQTVRIAMNSFKGDLYNTERIAIEFLSADDLYEENQEIYMSPMDFRIWYQEAIA